MYIILLNLHKFTASPRLQDLSGRDIFYTRCTLPGTNSRGCFANFASSIAAMAVVPNVFQSSISIKPPSKIKNCLPEHSVGKTIAILANKIIWRKKHVGRQIGTPAIDPDKLNTINPGDLVQWCSLMSWTVGFAIAPDMHTLQSFGVLNLLSSMVGYKIQNHSGSFRRMTMFFFSFACIKMWPLHLRVSCCLQIQFCNMVFLGDVSWFMNAFSTGFSHHHKH